MSELRCPNCGSKVVLPERESISMGITLAKNTDNNTYYLNMENNNNNNNTTTKENKTMGKISERLDALKNNGVDVSKFFAMTTPSGEEMMMKWENGVPVFAPESELDDYDLDEIEEEIYANGYVKNTKLHRRWVMAQMFKALEYKPYGYSRVKKYGFDGWLASHGYHYQWTMALEELRVMSKIEGKDAEAFAERSVYFNKYVIVKMLEDYLTKLKISVDGYKTRNCKGIPYKTFYRFGNVFVEDIDKKIYKPIRNTIKCIENANNYKSMYYTLSRFLNPRWGSYVKLDFYTPMSSVFVDAYKGEGAYYTLKNMVLFHDVKLTSYYTGEYMNSKDSYKYLQEMNKKYAGQGFRMFALLLQTIDYEKFDFDKRMEEIFR